MIQEDPAETRQTVVGHVRWFDSLKGFGFLVDSGGGSDALLHASVLKRFGRSSITEAAIIEAQVTETSRGRQVTEILSLRLPAGPPIAEMVCLPYDQLKQLPMLAARVKWFDRAKGFGFANVFGEAGDIFLHIDVLKENGFTDLTVGEAIALRVLDGHRGRVAAQILAWHSAVAEGERQ